MAITTDESLFIKVKHDEVEYLRSGDIRIDGIIIPKDAIRHKVGVLINSKEREEFNVFYVYRKYVTRNIFNLIERRKAV
jgi:hypothetical protein